MASPLTPELNCVAFVSDISSLFLTIFVFMPSFDTLCNHFLTNKQTIGQTQGDASGGILSFFYLLQLHKSIFK